MMAARDVEAAGACPPSPLYYIEGTRGQGWLAVGEEGFYWGGDQDQWLALLSDVEARWVASAAFPGVPVFIRAAERDAA